ncbi:MAG: DUF2993 domain-containing protein [Corynebacterium sp.]|uniref:LmeA family phospholipid-binding protein n=1 Tax=Corynebacterium sp. TaxID=1720 RepID=UPI0026DCC2FC|nr:DUF2993 domain-containing protein [Corynebacterium sp.]MDO5030675.1 DUF2993 domain-containing protein [Corynebacterium sp.]
MSISQRQKKIGGSVLAVAALIVAADMGLASHAEYKLSEHIRETANLEMTPYVAIGGKAYLSSFVTGKWSSVNSRIRDVEVPDFGLVSYEYGAANVKIPASSVLSGDFPESQTKQYFTKMSLDGVSLGNKLGLTDLSIQSLKDSSPAGGWETEAMFEGTPKGWKSKATVSAKLRIVNRDVIITPLDIISAPASATDTKAGDASALSDADAQHIRDTFSLTLRDQDIPLGMPATRVYVSGGSVTIEGEQIMCTVSPANFMPPTSKKDAEAASKSAEQLPEKNCRVRS